MRGRGGITAYLYLTFLVYAVSVTSIGPLMAELLTHYDLSLARGGLFVTFQAAGGLAALVLGGAVSDRTGKARLIGGCFLVYSVTLLAVGAAPGLLFLYALFFLLGASTRFMDMVANAYIADLHAEDKAQALSLLHAFFGVGALLGPLYARFLVDASGLWERSYTVLGFACLAVALAGAPAVLRAPVPARAGVGAGDPGSILGSRDVWVMAAALALYVAHQSGLTVWLPLYLERDLGMGRMASSAALSLFWLGIVAGRFITSLLSRHFPPRRTLLWGHLTGGIVLCVGAAAGSGALLTAAVAVAGLLTGAAYPLLVAMACARHPDRNGAVTSLLFASATSARMMFPWLAGVAGSRWGLLPGVFATGVVLLGVAVLIWALPVPQSARSG